MNYIKALKMSRKNIIQIIITIAITWLCIWFFSNDSDIMRQVKQLETQKDSLLNENKRLSLKNDTLVLLTEKEAVKHAKIKRQIKDKDNETDNAVNNVYTLDEQQLDSILRTYKHTKGN